MPTACVAHNRPLATPLPLRPPAHGGIARGQDGVVDTYDQDTVDAATAAVGLIDAQSNSMYGNQFISIVPGSVDTQVVAGMKYDMDIDVGVTACRNAGDGTTLSATKCPATVRSPPLSLKAQAGMKLAAQENIG